MWGRFSFSTEGFGMYCALALTVSAAAALWIIALRRDPVLISNDERKEIEKERFEKYLHRALA